VRERFGVEQHSGRNLAAFIDQLVDRLFVTVVTVTDELNAFSVFETLNARGVRLAATDLLKNYLFSLISSTELHDAELSTLETRWERVVGLLGSESYPEFLRVFWGSRNGFARPTELFKTIKRRVATRASAFALLRDLDHSASTYAALRDGHDRQWSADEREAIELLRLFDARQPLALLLACHAKFFESQRRGFARIL